LCGDFLISSAILRSAVIVACLSGVSSGYAQSGDLFPGVRGERPTTVPKVTPTTLPATAPVAQTIPATAPAAIAGSSDSKPVATAPATASVASTAPATSTAPAAKTKPAPPAQADMAAADKLIMEVFGADIQKAKTPAEKSLIIATLLAAAGDEKSPSGKYAIYARVKILAVEIADLDTLLAIVEKLDAEFDVDRYKLVLDSFLAVNNKILTIAQKQYAYAFCSKWTQRCVDVGRFDVAKPLGDLNLNFSRNTGDTNDFKAATQLVAVIREGELASADMKAASAVLEKTPDDPAANLRVGNFLCYFKNDWKAGLKHIAAGSNKALADLAKLELSGADAPEDKMKLADGWWDASAALTGIPRMRAQHHSASFYYQLADNAAGLTKAKIDKRIAESGYKPGAEVFGGAAGGGSVAINDPFIALIEKIPKDLIAVPGEMAQGHITRSAALRTWLVNESGFFSSGPVEATVVAQYANMNRVNVKNINNGVEETTQRYFIEFTYKLKTRGVPVTVTLSLQKSISGPDDPGLKVLKNLEAAGKGAQYNLTMTVQSLSVFSGINGGASFMTVTASSGNDFTVTPAK
jgi:hypothetical protein